MRKSIILCIIVLAFSGCYQTQELEQAPNRIPKNSACFESGNCVSLEIAGTAQERATGLMNRQKLDENAGMLFIFDYSDRHSFWMKNTLIPLDIIWIGANGKIVYIAENVRPCTITDCPSIKPTESALLVLETNAGKARENNLQTGQKVFLNYDS